MVTNEMIRSFLDIVEYGNISMAADASHITQSALSKQLMALEDETGTTLLIRRRGHSQVSLTPRGEEFLRLARKWQSLHREFEDVKNYTEISEVSIGAQDRINTYTFRNLYNEILDRHAEIRLDIHTRHSREIYAMMESHALDIGLASNLFPTRNITVRLLFEEPLLLVSYKNPALGETVSPEELDPDKEIFSRWSDAFEIWHNQLWPGKRYRMHVGTTSMIPSHLSREGRWSIMPVSALNVLMETMEFSLHRLSVETPIRSIYLLEQKYPQPTRLHAIETFKKEMLAYLQKDSYIRLL